MKKTKLEKGITLVALIITIVVLLILAVVSIGAVRNSGIIGHATNTSDAWKKAQKEENTYLEGYEEKLLESTGAKVIKYVGEVPIPAGFEYVEGTKDTGLVIKNSTEGSEFVWIPVNSGSLPSVSDEPAVVTEDNNLSNLKVAGMPENSTSKDFLTQLTAEYDAMVASVAEYKGFYVGRYEVSYNSATKKAQSVKKVTSANASDSTSKTWYGLYALCKTYKTSSVTGSMIYGSQWEAIMNFIGEDKDKTDGGNTTSVTGSIDTDKIKRIYDLIGNSYEWTQEAYTNSYRVRRGGNYNISNSPNYRNSSSPAYICYYSSRLALYIEL